MRPHLGRLMLAYVAISLALGLQLIVPKLLQRAVDRGIVAGDRDYLVRAAVLLVLVTIAFSICLFFRVYLFTVFAEHIAFDLRQAIYGHLQTLSFSFYDAHQTGQLMARATEDINNIRALIYSGMRTIFMLRRDADRGIDHPVSDRPAARGCLPGYDAGAVL